MTNRYIHTVIDSHVCNVLSRQRCINVISRSNCFIHVTIYCPVLNAKQAHYGYVMDVTPSTFMLYIWHWLTFKKIASVLKIFCACSHDRYFSLFSQPDYDNFCFSSWTWQCRNHKKDDTFNDYCNLFNKCDEWWQPNIQTFSMTCGIFPVLCEKRFAKYI